MKIKLLLVLFFVGGISFAQIPTNGLSALYNFDNGALTDTANNNNFTQVGTALVARDDRFTTVNTNAIGLNGDYLTRPDINFTTNSNSVSFWIKTTTINGNVETIFDDAYNRNSVADNTTWSGYYLFLQNGKVGFVIQQLFAASNIGRVGIKKTGTAIVSDGKWHHITLTINQVITSTGQYRAGRLIRKYLTTANLYVDDIFEEQAIINKNSEFSFLPNGNTDSAGDIVIANNRSNSLPNVNRYADLIDDILIYDRILTRAEIAQIRRDGYFCSAPPQPNIGITNIGETTATISITGNGNYDVAYYKNNEPFSSAIIVNNVTATPINLTGLDVSTTYNVLYREYCNNISDWSIARNFITLRPAGIIYVDADATGNNNGLDWANAYTDLQDAILITSSSNNKEIWVAKGTYKPSTTNRSFAFRVNAPDVKIYGGFAGTETQLSSRVFGVNETILSGDLQDNDVNVTDFAANYANSSRNQDNSYHIISLTNVANNTLLDGLTVSGAHNNLNSTERGGAIIKDKSVAKLTLKNCVIKDNVSRNDNAGLIAEFELNNTSGTRGELIIENCKFINNMSRWASGLYSFVRANSNVNITVANCLFDNNLAADLSSTLTGISGSASWFRVIENGSDVNLTLVNNTYVNHKDYGTAQSLNNFNRAVVGLSKGAGITSTFNATVSNCIFWDNLASSNGTKSRSITDLYKLPLNSLTINNSLDELSFNDDSITSKSNNINSNPSFNANYSLKANSPAIDMGNNTNVFGATDLLANQRIFNTTVDMGAFEFGSIPLNTNYFQLDESVIKIYPNPSTAILNIRMTQNLKQATIYSVLGAEVIKSTSKVLNTSTLKSGLYLVKIEDKKGKVITKRFVKE